MNNLKPISGNVQFEITILLLVIFILAITVLVLTIVKKIKDKD